MLKEIDELNQIIINEIQENILYGNYDLAYKLIKELPEEIGKQILNSYYMYLNQWTIDEDNRI
ncbi:MAG: hypothetical protein KatS3mg002_1577 [Candidatus Woesearchaeota archaeon]|nr:MAG: hypothetical protein KatS3mg002_1577 [Candidatus Woesearchaeota archaeon]